MGIERYRAIVRLEEIRSFMEQEEYDKAKEVADSIRREKLKDSADLFLLASVYRKCGEYDTAKSFLMRIYEKKVTWRVLEELMEVCLAEKNPDEAQSYLQQYAKLSGGDPRNYIYEYRIGRQKHRPDAELLPVLQTLKAEEYSEKYAYELAKLYHKLGMEQECMAECRDLILWFGEGTYVERAKALQAYYRGELSVEDIREEADRRIREVEERRAREEEERRAFEEEQRRLEEVRLREEAERRRAEEEASRFEEEERFAIEAMCRSIAEDSIAAGEMEQYPETEKEYEYEEASYDTDMMETEPEEFVAETEESSAYYATMEAVFEEVAVAEISEPMWEEDASILVADEVPSEEPEETNEYEQMSLFAAADKEPEEEEFFEELPEEPQTVSQLGKELSIRLAEKGIVFETVLHEFARIERVRKQLLRMLEVVVTVRKKCHCLIITGERKSGKTTLGTYLAKLLYELSYVKSPRVAKISGERLNGMNLFEKQQQLKDACLIVECAGKMTDETVNGLLTFIQQTDVLGTVILEDNANAMSRLLRNNAECNRIFNNRVHLPKYDNNELMGFALEYIAEQDYEISNEAKHILGRQIEYITRTEQKDGRLVATMELVKTALANADYRNQGTILAMASAANFLAAEALELTAEDFGIIR